MFNSLLNNFSKKGFQINHIQYDFPLEEHHTNWVKHDFFSNPLGFDSNKVPVEESLPFWTAECKDNNIQYVVAIDSLSPLLLRLPVTDIFSAIRHIVLRSIVFITYHLCFDHS